MKPIEFKEQNRTLGKPDRMTDEQCGSLPIFNNGEECISCWQLTDEELEKLKETKCIWLGVVSGFTQPPVFLSVDAPFVDPQNKFGWKIYIISVEGDRYWVIAKGEDEAVECLMGVEDLKDCVFDSIREASIEEITNTKIENIEELQMPTLLDYHRNYNGEVAQVICSTAWVD